MIPYRWVGGKLKCFFTLTTNSDQNEAERESSPPASSLKQGEKTVKSFVFTAPRVASGEELTIGEAFESDSI